MKKLIADLLSSKKFAALAFGLAVTLMAYPLHRWLGLEAEEASRLSKQIGELVIAGVAAYVLAQGASDHGKEAAKVNAEAARASRPAPITSTTTTTSNTQESGGE